MFNGVELGQEVNLVERDFTCDGVLGMLHTTIGEFPSLNGQLSELLLEDIQQLLDNSMFSNNLEVINMNRHDAQQNSGTTVLET